MINQHIFRLAESVIYKNIPFVDCLHPLAYSIFLWTVTYQLTIQSKKGKSTSNVTVYSNVFHFTTYRILVKNRCNYSFFKRNAYLKYIVSICSVIVTYVYMWVVPGSTWIQNNTLNLFYNIHKFVYQ